MATNRDFFAFMEKRHGSEFAVHRGAWPDWWANGNGSAAGEVACSRRAKASLWRSAAVALRLKRGRQPEYLRARREALEDILLFDEHTWGDAKSVAAPWSPHSRAEWETKRAFAHRGLVESVRLEQSLLACLDPKAEVLLFNPHSVRVTMPVALRSTGDGLTAPVLADTRSGRRIEGQRADADATAAVPADWYLVPVPARAHRAFVRKEPRAPASAEDRLENGHYRIACDSRGSVVSVFDKKLGRNLVSGAREWSFGELIHERVPGALGRRAFYDRSFGVNSQESKRTPARLVRTGGDSRLRRMHRVGGPVFASVVASGDLPGVWFEREIRLYRDLARVDLFLRLHKDPRTQYESLYVAFPFGIKPRAVWVENAGAVFRAGEDQLPGSATDWLSIGEYAAVEGDRGVVVLAPHDAPLAQIGGINTGRWMKRLRVRNGRLFSWVMNNMWPTNFPGHQEGVVELAWSLTSHGGSFNERRAREFAAAARVGLSVRDAAGEPGVPKSW